MAHGLLPRVAALPAIGIIKGFRLGQHNQRQVKLHLEIGGLSLKCRFPFTGFQMGLETLPSMELPEGAGSWAAAE